MSKTQGQGPTVQAHAALTDWQDTATAEKTASDTVRAAGRFKKRRATADHRTAKTIAQDAERRLTAAWGEPPRWGESGVSWVERVTRPRIDAHPRVLDAQRTADAAQAAGNALDKLHRTEVRALRSDIFGAERVRKQPLRYEFIRPEREVASADRAAAKAREEIAQLRGMSVRNAAKRIEAQRHAAERVRLAREARARKLHSTSHDHDFGTSSGPHRDGPSLGF